MNMKKVMMMKRMKVRIIVMIWELSSSEDDVFELNIPTNVNFRAVTAIQVDQIWGSCLKSRNGGGYGQVKCEHSCICIWDCISCITLPQFQNTC